jgi:murein DD-endopeptidase MepM/ murein hydrolase activator NlpD
VRRTLLTPFLGVVVLLAVLALAPRASADGGDLQEARARADKAAAQLARAETELGKIDADIRSLEAEAAAAQATLDGLRGAVRELAVKRFINADASQTSTLDPDINAQARADALSRFATQGNQDAIEDYDAATEDLQVATEQLAAKKADQQQAIEALEQRRAQLEEEFRRLEALERERQEAERKRREEAARQAAAAAAQASSSRRATPIRSAPTAPIAHGDFVCPVQGPVAFTDTWGEPRSGGRAHQGVDMLSPRGTPVVAPVSGVVSHRGNSIGGLSFHLNGDNGHYYYGTHLDSYANVGAGHVAAGTVVGYVGDTGNARGTPHLHFEIHPNGGAAVNPYPTVRAAC